MIQKTREQPTKKNIEKIWLQLFQFKYIVIKDVIMKRKHPGLPTTTHSSKKILTFDIQPSTTQKGKPLSKTIKGISSENFILKGDFG